MNNRNTELFRIEAFDIDFITKIESICKSISLAGFDPYSQLTGYLLTGNDFYITRTGDARAIIETLEKEKIQTYIKTHLEK